MEERKNILQNNVGIIPSRSENEIRCGLFLFMDFSLFKTITQRVSVLNNNPPAMRVETICYTKKSPIRYNIVVQATIVRKDGDFNG